MKPSTKSCRHSSAAGRLNHENDARVAVIGGGAVGASILYHLARSGWTDCILLERTELTAGSTWHAAGLLPLYNPDYTMSQINLRSLELYGRLEAETGQPVGLHRCGQLRLATSADRLDEYRHYLGSVSYTHLTLPTTERV